MYANVVSFGAFLALDDDKLNALAWRKTRTVFSYRAEMNEYFISVLATDKTKALCTIKPLH